MSGPANLWRCACYLTFEWKPGINTCACGKKYNISVTGEQLSLDATVQQHIKENIPFESRTDIEPRLKYAVFYMPRMQGVAMYDNSDEAIACVEDYKKAGHSQVEVYVKANLKKVEVTLITVEADSKNEKDKKS